MASGWQNSETKKIVDLAEGYMQAADDETRLKMKDSFVTAMKLEYMFWDGIYSRAKWAKLSPVAELREAQVNTCASRWTGRTWLPFNLAQPIFRLPQQVPDARPSRAA
jgi:hypothetical protein